MAFVPRVFEQILADMIAYVRANTTLTDFNIGSVIRTILEAAALEDDEQYHQMVQLLDAFRFATATGTDLDERAADFNLTRLGAAQAVGVVQFQNGGLTYSTLLYDVTVGATSITLADSSDFPVSGFPITIRLGEGTAAVEDVSCTANSILTGVLTIAATSNAHSAGDRVAQTTGVSTQTVPSGTQVQVPAQGANLPIVFQTVETGTITAGNRNSNLVSIQATQGGVFGNVGTGVINQFTGSSPFVGAQVTNPSSTGGGRDEETDQQFRDRIKLRLRALSRGTPAAIEGGIIGIESSDTGQRVVTAKLMEDFTDEEHLLYVDDGTGFVPDTVILATSAMANSPAAGATTLQLNDASDFPASGKVIIVSSTSSLTEVVPYESKTGNILTLEVPAVTANAHVAGESVLLIDDLGVAEEGQNFFQASNYPIRRNTIQVYDNSTGAFELKAEGTDYFFNRTNGELQYFGAGLPVGTQVVLTYTYYTGLFALAQKVVNGDPQDSINFPGLAAAGTIIYVDVPTIRSIQVIATISVAAGIDEATATANVQLVIENYVDSRTIGQNVILAQIIDRVMSVDGVENVSISQPTADVVILEDELSKSFDSNGNSLVAVL